MNQVSQAVWNQIALTQRIKNLWALKAMALNQMEVTEMLEDQADQLADKLGFSNKAILAFQLTSLLLAEHKAIQNFVMEQGNYQLVAALPEILTPEEAINLATLELNLSKSQQDEVLPLLEELV